MFIQLAAYVKNRKTLGHLDPHKLCIIIHYSETVHF